MRPLTLAPFLVLLGGLPVAGQTAVPFTRADTQVTIGWNNIRHPLDKTNACCYSHDWIHDIALAEATGGWFWTEHLRTTFDVGVNSDGQQYADATVVYNGQPVYRAGSITLHQWQVGVGQQYQFGHNAWFHPHVGGGALIAFNQQTVLLQPGYYYDQSSRTTRVISDISRTTTNETTLHPFAEAGFKAYVSRKVYFVHDTRFTFASDGLGQVGFNFGFGVDFW